jgi:hypothetical protein
MRIFSICLFLAAAVFASAQEEDLSFFRGSIPEELLRPKRGEAPRYPIDTVIGEIGMGRASAAAYSFASSIATGLVSGEMGHRSLSGINPVLREGYLSALKNIECRNFRLGGGREEPDGAVSFLVRFTGKEQGITGELFVRYVTKETERVLEEETEIIIEGNWTFDDLILEEAKSREEERRDSLQRFDFSPYERFF